MILKISIIFIVLLIIISLRQFIVPVLTICAIGIIGYNVLVNVTTVDLLELFYGAWEKVYLSKPAGALGNFYYNLCYNDDPEKLKKINKKRAKRAELAKKGVNEFNEVKKTKKYEKVKNSDKNKNLLNGGGLGKWFESDASKFKDSSSNTKKDGVVNK